MDDQQAVIVGLGMMTAVGLTAAETAASVRAGVMRFAETSWLDRQFRPFVLAKAVEDGLPDLHETLAGDIGLTGRDIRMLRLGAMPLAECLQSVASLSPRPPLHLALPEGETTAPLDRPAMLKRLAKQTEATFDPEQSDATLTGRAGGLLAVGRAVEKIGLGETDFVLAGGIDTYCDLHLLGTLDVQQRVKSALNLDGFIPGEGAAFVLLAGSQAAEAAGLTPLARVSSAVEGLEEGHLDSEEPYQGEGLAETFSEFFAEHEPDEPVAEVYSSMNGENHWAKEWGVAFLRNQAAFDPEHGMHHPADCFGDAAAACGPLLVGLAALGIAQGYRRNPSLVYCSSDYGPRAVLSVSSV